MTVTWSWQDDLGHAVDPEMVEGLRKKIHATMQRRKDHHVELLRALIRHKTISGAATLEEQLDSKQHMRACLDDVAAEARRLGLDWREHQEMAAVAEWKASGMRDSLGVAMHLDVVPPGDGWRRDPFGGELVDGEVWGRGAQDDKGPVAAVLAAVDVLQAMGLEPVRDVRLFFGTLEETEDWPDMDALLEAEEPPTVTLVPDGAFPIVVAEKGIITVEWQAQWREDGPWPRFLGLRSGTRHNVVPDHAELWFACPDQDAARKKLERLPGVGTIEPMEAPAGADVPCLRVTFQGTASHAAFPQQGDNAALHALRALHVHSGETGAGRFAAMLLDACVAHDGSGLGLARTHGRMGDSSLSLGVVEAGPAAGHAQINVRFPMGITTEDVLRRFRSHVRDRAGINVNTRSRGRPQDPIFVSPEDHPRLMTNLRAAYEAGTGRKAGFGALAGTTYAKAFPLAVVFGPQDPNADEPVLAHRTDERVSIERFEENVCVYALALALLAC